jgi:hypothetical protein
MFDLYDELRKVIAAFDKNQIDYALCGGLAMAVYDHPRATIDIDMLIPPEAFDAIPEIAKHLGYTKRGLDMSFANGAIEIRRVSKIHSETGHVLSLDLLLVTPAIRDVWNSRVDAHVEGAKLSVVSRRGLIALKKLRGSGRDLDDIAALKEDIGDATN